MTTSKEIVINKGLNGEEVKQLLRHDFERLLANEGLLSPHVAYGRIAWDIRLRLHTNNPMSPDSESFVVSQPEGKNIVAKSPELGAVEKLPLNPAPENSVVSAQEVTHAVESPNLERVHNAMPVPVNVKQNDGTTSQQQVVYPSPDPGQFPPPNVTVKDVSGEARQDLKVKS